MVETSTVSATYLVGITLVALKLGWHMAFRLDRFDWQYAKRDMWRLFVLASLIWPLLLLTPRVLFDPRRLFQRNFSLAAMRRKEARFWSNLPPCGKFIRFRPIKEVLAGGDGEFTFLSADVEDAIADNLREYPRHLANDQLRSVLRWLRQRDESIVEPTSVPSTWWQFHGIADAILRNGRGEIHCITCNCQVPIETVKQNDCTGQPGWNFNQLRCPHGHILICVETVHIFVR